MNRRVLVLTFLLLTPMALLAHEGHDALPTKGVMVKGNTVALTLEAVNAIGLKTADVSRQRLARAILAPVTVELTPGAHAFATTLLTGRIERILVSPGEEVSSGQVLAYIQAPDLERLRLESKTAAFDAELAQAELERTEDLARQGVRNPQEVRAARSKAQDRANALLVARLKLRALGLGAGESDERASTEPSVAAASAESLLPVRAPLAGIVGHIDVSQGAIVDPQQHLFDIVNPKLLRLRMEPLEAYLPLIALDQRVEVRLRGQPAGAPGLQTHIASRDLHVDGKRLVERMWLPVPDQTAGLRPGMAGQARIIVAERDQVLTIPEQAVVRAGMETFVFVQTQPAAKTRPGMYDRKHVTLGLSEAGMIEVRTGLFSIDAVVVLGQRQLATLFVQNVLRPTPEARRNYGLKVAPVRTQAVGQVLEVDAQLELPPAGHAVLAAPVGGKVVAVKITEPGAVRAGAPLVELSSLDFQSLQLELIQAELAARLHQGTLDSYARTDPPSAIPMQLRQEAETLLRVARARADSLTRRLRTMGLGDDEVQALRAQQQVRSSFWLRAPRSGHALPRDLAIGQVVKEGLPLVEVQDRTRLLVRGGLFDHQLPLVHVGQTGRVRLPARPGFEVAARVTRIETVQHEGRLVRSVWAEISNPDGLLMENQLARLAIDVGTGSEVLAVPHSALQREGGSWSVFVHDPAKDVFLPRSVTVGRRDDRHAEIVQGVQVDEQIAVTAVTDLRRGYGRIK